MSERLDPNVPADAGQTADDLEVAALFARLPDPGARDEIAVRFVPFAEYLARRFAGRGEPLDDLLQPRVVVARLMRHHDERQPAHPRALELSSYAALGWTAIEQRSRAVRRLDEGRVALADVEERHGQLGAHVVVFESVRSHHSDVRFRRRTGVREQDCLRAGFAVGVADLGGVLVETRERVRQPRPVESALVEVSVDDVVGRAAGDSPLRRLHHRR